ncbi:MAG: response regulator [Candidatus Promineifilaceae bacterium]
MADVKQILIVDDHFEMLEFLRTILEHSGREYQVLAVPSAEEGMLELLRTRFDLLITDVRLPGMSGFDLIRRVRRVRQELPVIMISGYGVEQGQKEAAALGVVHYFIKPLDSDLLVSTVQRVLYGEPVIEPPQPAPASSAAATPTLPTLPKELTTALNQRLYTLRNEISATYVALADRDNRVVTDSGLGGGLLVPSLLTAVVASHNHSQTIATHLNNQDAFSMQYQSGDKVDLYAVSVGRHYLLLIFFAAEARRGRVGTVWVFAQRLAKELMPLLPADLVQPPPTVAKTGPITATPTVIPPEPTRSVPDLPDFPSKTPTKRKDINQLLSGTTPSPSRSTSKATGKTTPPPPTPVTPPPVAKTPAPTRSTPPAVAKTTPPPVDPRTASATPGPSFSFAEAMKQGLIPSELVDLEPADEASLAGLFDLSPAEASSSKSEAFSFAEAMKQGLIPGDLAGLAPTTEAAAPDIFSPAPTEASSAPGEAFSFAEAIRQGLIPGNLANLSEESPDTTTDSLTNWLDLPTGTIPDELTGDWLADAAATEPLNTTETGNGLSLEQARALGLLPPELLGEAPPPHTTNWPICLLWMNPQQPLTLTPSGTMRWPRKPQQNLAASAWPKPRPRG